VSSVLEAAEDRRAEFTKGWIVMDSRLRGNDGAPRGLRSTGLRRPAENKHTGLLHGVLSEDEGLFPCRREQHHMGSWPFIPVQRGVTLIPCAHMDFWEAR